ncbi:protein POLYCHOME-like [Punica granatum]|uniref:Uncharacterized protein n=2 Tax=Punica granatum TaxID=22663 RepID=A0A218VU77_PUNGR|nr:protein POLYCHOME-like [Punica granatum]OWM63452.1 hypothetical protein CDL15_Pgr022197 [Punica granatum]PKI72518.1 hypothetical protein CRG98_007121 [Punica granatum]
MSVSRDRLVRPVDPAAEFALRRSLGIPRNEGDSLFESPIQQTTPEFLRAGGWLRVGSPRASSVPRGRGRERPPSSTLPSWYLRTPLSDITLISRAFARRRARLAEAQVHEADSLLLPGSSPLNPSLQLSGAPLEHEPSLVTPSSSPSVGTDNPLASDNCPPPIGNVSKILHDVANHPVASDNSECSVDVTDQPIASDDSKFLASRLQLSGAPLEHEPSLVTPSPSVDTDKPAASDNGPPTVVNVSKILAETADQPVASDNSECSVGSVSELTDKPVASDDCESLAPQKKLLNQIETVQKKVMDKLKKLKRTRAAKKAERERKVRILLSMR